jgi:iron complex outermembrane recepter protein
MTLVARIVLTCGILYGLGSQGAVAAAELSGTLQEVVVTAERRPEKLSQVPDSLTVFTSKDIESSRIQNVRDFVAMTPNFEIHQGQSPGIFQMCIRGICQANMGAAPVAMVVDGVTLPYSDTFAQPLFDIQQIEVLKGPQGALYGQNSIGGAIVVTTKQPTSTLQGSFTQSLGRGGDIRSVGVLSGPIIADRLLFRVGALYHDTRGLVPFAFVPGRRADYENDKAVRAEFTALLSDTVTAVLGYSWNRTTGGALPLVAVSNSLGSGIPGVTTRQIDSSIALGEPSGDTPNLNVYATQSAWLKLDWTFPGARLTSVTAAQSLNQIATQDLDVTGIPFVREEPGRIPTRAWLQELRLTSTGQGPWQWMLDAFAQQVHHGFSYIVQLNTGLLASPPDLSPAQANWIPFQYNDLNQHLNAYAFAAQTSYRFTHRLQLTVSGRYDHDPETSQTTTFAGSQPLLRATFSEFEPKASLSYAFHAFGADQHVYFTYAQGFRPGGFNSGVNSEVALAFPSETTRNFEIGAKLSLLSGRLYLDLDGFHNIYSNQQQALVVVSQGGATSDIFSIKRTNINGFEVSMQAAPGAGFSVSAGVGYTDAKIADFGDSLAGTGLNPAEFIGRTVPLVSKYTINLTVEQTVPLTDRFDGFWRLDGFRNGRIYWYPDNVYSQDPYNLVNAQIGVRRAHWSVDLYGKNIFGQRYNVLFFDNNFVRAPGGINFAYRSRPGTYGIEGKLSF